jgi:transcriptional regulator with GAF, ATPase, and Fis domain
VQDGRLRADLYYRLSVFPIAVPPLRERREDIAALARHLLAQVQTTVPGSACSLTDQDIVLLRAHDWPGNVRELRNVIEQAVISSHDGRLNLHDAMPRPADGRADLPDATEPGFLMSDAEWQRRYQDNIAAALVASNWKIEGHGGAAQLLGMNPSTLRYRIKALGIRRPAAQESSNEPFSDAILCAESKP